MNIKTLIDEKKIENRIKEVAKQIENDYSNEEIVIICILKGAAFFATDLAKRINLPVTVDFMKVSSYEGTESTKKIDFKLDISTDISNKNGISVEDIVDTWRTLTYLKDYLNTTYFNTFTEAHQKMIAEVLWNMGAVVTSDNYGGGLPKFYYENERSNVVFEGESETWNGKIALMYPSDYGFAVGGGTTNRSNCLNMKFSEWKYKTCHTNNWLHKTDTRLLTPHSLNKYFYNITMGAYGSLWFQSPDGARTTYPAFYLKSNVHITSGTGSSSDPFELQLDE